MGSLPYQHVPYERSHLLYNEKAPYDEDETHQASAAEDISIGLVEDIVNIIAGGVDGYAWSCTLDIVFQGTKFPERFGTSRASRHLQGGSDTEVQQKAVSHLYEDGDPCVMMGYCFPVGFCIESYDLADM